MKLRHAPRVFLVSNPPQDYEESLRIHGVHGSLAAAKLAARRYRRGGDYDGELDWRQTRIELRQGDRVLDQWTFDPRTGRWSHSKPEEPRMDPRRGRGRLP